MTPLEQAGPGLQGRLGFPEPPPRQEGAPRPRDEGNGQAVAARGTRPLGTAQAARASGPRPLRPAVPCRAFLCSGPPVSHVSGKLALPFFFLKEAAIFGTRGRRLAPQSRRPPPVPLLRTLVLGGLGGVTRSLPTRAGIPTGWAASGLKGRRGPPPRCLPSLPTLQREVHYRMRPAPAALHSFTHSLIRSLMFLLSICCQHLNQRSPQIVIPHPQCQHPPRPGYVHEPHPGPSEPNAWCGAEQSAFLTVPPSDSNAQPILALGNAAGSKTKSLNSEFIFQTRH